MLFHEQYCIQQLDFYRSEIFVLVPIGNKTINFLRDNAERK
jgi:hypothetical protein